MNSVSPSPRRGLRVALLSPRGPLYKHGSGIWKKSLRYMPLTLTTLAALVPEELGAELRLFEEGIDDIPLDLEADLVGLSVITGSATRSYELADHFRSRGLPVVLGGVHPTLLPDEAAAHADAVVVGYAEETWPELLRDFAAGCLKPRYDMAPDFRLENVPIPRRDLLPADHYFTRHTIEATRGCNHNCEFCVVPTAWGGPRQRPVAEVLAEVRAMNPKKLLFLDLNLVANPDYARELFRALAPLGIRWGGLSTIDIAFDDELLDLAAAGGCRGLLIGFESLSQASLAETRKLFNTTRDYGDAMRRFHDRKIAIMACFVFGFDHDTRDSFAETAELAIEARIDLPRFAIVTPFPGTPLFRRLKADGRILTEDWDLYDAQHVVFRPARMTPEELLRGTEWAWKKVYGLSSIAKRLLGAWVQPWVSLPANLGYRFYARNLHRFYTCRGAPV
ncbi:MAG: B12-binding domain-containing radical SAM protein [Deltaproteobacteria bacterium]|nr:B12-binding domain-containing radical SAM protein [Deltaproteobacteria bacterium]